MPISPQTASLIGSGVNAGASIIGSMIASHQQRRLLDYQYESFRKNAAAAGATPAAIAQGITASGPASTPSVSSLNPLPDVGSNLVHAFSVASESARRDVQNDVDMSMLPWNIRQYDASIKEAYSRIRLNRSSVGLNRQLRSLYAEQEKDLRVKRPWQIAEMSQGLTNAMAMYNQIVAQTNTIRKQGNLYDQQSALFGQQTVNARLSSYRLQFENMMLHYGWDTNSNWFQNVMRNAFTSPAVFKSFWSNTSEVLNFVDSKAKDSLGKDYKRDALLLYGLGYGLKSYQDHIKGNLGLISKFAPKLFK